MIQFKQFKLSKCTWEYLFTQTNKNRLLPQWLRTAVDPERGQMCVTVFKRSAAYGVPLYDAIKPRRSGMLTSFYHDCFAPSGLFDLLGFIFRKLRCTYIRLFRCCPCGAVSEAEHHF